MADDPLTRIDDLVVGLLKNFSAVSEEAGVPQDNIQVWESEINLDDDPENDIDSGPRIWLVPVGTRPDYTATSGAADIELRYQVGYGTAALKRQNARAIEWVLIRLGARLYKGIGADGLPLDYGSTAPLVIQQITGGSIDPERDPIDAPEEWQGVFEIIVLASVLLDKLVQ